MSHNIKQKMESLLKRWNDLDRSSLRFSSSSTSNLNASNGTATEENGKSILNSISASPSASSNQVNEPIRSLTSIKLCGPLSVVSQTKVLVDNDDTIYDTSEKENDSNLPETETITEQKVEISNTSSSKTITTTTITKTTILNDNNSVIGNLNSNRTLSNVEDGKIEKNEHNNEDEDKEEEEEKEEVGGEEQEYAYDEELNYKNDEDITFNKEINKVIIKTIIKKQVCGDESSVKSQSTQLGQDIPLISNAIDSLINNQKFDEQSNWKRLSKTSSNEPIQLRSEQQQSTVITSNGDDASSLKIIQMTDLNETKPDNVLFIKKNQQSIANGLSNSKSCELNEKMNGLFKILDENTSQNDMEIISNDLFDWLLWIDHNLQSQVVTVGDLEEIQQSIYKYQVTTKIK